MLFSVCGLFISFLEWLLSKILKVLILFSVWANREISRRSSSTKLKKKRFQKVSYIDTLLDKALMMFRWEITEHKAGFHLASLNRGARREGGVSNLSGENSLLHNIRHLNLNFWGGLIYISSSYIGKRFAKKILLRLRFCVGNSYDPEDPVP